MTSEKKPTYEQLEEYVGYLEQKNYQLSKELLRIAERIKGLQPWADQELKVNEVKKNQPQ